MRLRTKLARVWLALLVAGAALGLGAGAGPFDWFATWFAVQTGRLIGADILFLLLVLALPSLWILFEPAGRGRRRGAASAGRDRRRVAPIVLFALAGGSLAVAALAGLQVARLPGGGAPAVPLAGPLADAAAAGRRVATAGAPIPNARAQFRQPARRSSSLWTYTGFRPGATRGALAAAGAARGPVALFVERRENEVSSPYPYIPPRQDEVAGYLVENGLPDHARIVLERAGVTIAAPHYLLKVSEDGLREPWFVPLFLGLFFAFIFGVIGAMALVKARPGRPLHRTAPGLSARSRRSSRTDEVP